MCVGAPVGTADMNSIINGLSLQRLSAERLREQRRVAAARLRLRCPGRGAEPVGRQCLPKLPLRQCHRARRARALLARRNGCQWK